MRKGPPQSEISQKQLYSMGNAANQLGSWLGSGADTMTVKGHKQSPFEADV